MISEDSYSLTINLLSITFNIPDASYYVEINDNFVKYKYDGPKTIIPGIKPGNWIIKTLPSKCITTELNWQYLKLNLN